MDYDANCTLHTAAALYNLHRAPLHHTVQSVSRVTGFMEGPPHGVESVSEMLTTLGVSDGTYEMFRDPSSALAYIRLLPLFAACAFGYEYRNGNPGHVVVAINSLGGVVLQDHQIHEQGLYAPITIGVETIPADADLYTVWRPGHGPAPMNVG